MCLCLWPPCVMYVYIWWKKAITQTHVRYTHIQGGFNIWTEVKYVYKNGVSWSHALMDESGLPLNRLNVVNLRDIFIVLLYIIFYCSPFPDSKRKRQTWTHFFVYVSVKLGLHEVHSWLLFWLSNVECNTHSSASRHHLRYSSIRV